MSVEGGLSRIDQPEPEDEGDFGRRRYSVESMSHLLLRREKDQCLYSPILAAK